MPGPVNRIERAAVDGWWHGLGARLCPPRCLACGEAAPPGTDLCPACTAALPWNVPACPRCAVPLPGASSPAPSCGACQRRPPPLDATHAAFAYRTPLDRLLPRFKFHRDLAAGRLLADAMASCFVALPRPDALLPVPLHPGRLRRRGYDQALELARPLARTLRLPLLDGALVRTRATAPQSELDAASRRRNLREAFTVRDGTRLPAHVVLVDDVMTTGATLHAAAVTLRRAGVTRVEAWVCARVP
ncbi:ComF family protein [Luteimonas kalidii]|uniref:ComF family protein n=1 Tax=Luteimonas kalidii TaxID=3042025 RepID=A0ABT6JS70_9GAMM|nr:ComF family protein [Luteimonas kalidii]MDH5833322.1 ComF family protein [Luteimonas kalidii]